MAETKTLEWTISAEGVGEAVVGRRLPRSLASAGLGARYFARNIADFQPDEGFRFEDPPIEVSIGSGPFARLAKTEPAEPDAPALAPKAVKAVAAGAKVRAIRVVGPGPRTAKGIGVGSALADLQAAYPDHRLHPVPPTLGRDECVATSPSLPGVVFVFASCKVAQEGGSVVRVDLGPR